MTQNQFECPQCTAKFPNEGSLERHMRMAHSQPQHACPDCGAIFQSEDELDAHVRALHPESQQHPS
ncbi:MAG: C2H2-type zinc finger protein [Chloroflexota bacterium]